MSVDMHVSRGHLLPRFLHCQVYVATLLLLLWSVWRIEAAATNNSTRKPPGEIKPLWNATWTDKLKRDLMLSYDKFSRPAQHTNTTVVTIDLNLKHVDLDEMSSIMTVYAWVKMFWMDEKLKWNATDYGGLTKLHLADHELWQPDIALYNSASGSEVDHYGNTHSIVHEDGTVLWVPPSQFRAFCDLNLRHWPYDEQTCTLRLGSWTYDGDQVDLQLEAETEAELDEDWMVNNSEWELINMAKQRNVAYYTCCVEAYIDVSYTLTLKRRSPAYSAVVVTPAIVVVFLTLAGFWLPPHAGEKVTLNAFTALIICILLMAFSYRLPAMANHTPLIVVFYSVCLVLVSMALIEAVLVINLSRNPRRTTLPWILRRALASWPVQMLCFGAAAHASLGPGGVGEELRDHGDEQSNTLSEERQMIPTGSAAKAGDWHLLAVASDRTCFVLYCFIFAILAIAYV